MKKMSDRVSYYFVKVKVDRPSYCIDEGLQRSLVLRRRFERLDDALCYIISASSGHPDYASVEAVY